MKPTKENLDALEVAQADLVSRAEELGDISDVDRRAFVFMSMAAVAATTLGIQPAVAQRGAQGAAETLVEVPLEEPPGWTFQPYPGGTGALLNKTLKDYLVVRFDEPLTQAATSFSNANRAALVSYIMWPPL